MTVANRIREIRLLMAWNDARPAPSGWGDIVFAQIRRFVMKRWLIGSGILFVLAILGITVSIFPNPAERPPAAQQPGRIRALTLFNIFRLIPSNSFPIFLNS